MYTYIVCVCVCVYNKYIFLGIALCVCITYAQERLFLSSSTKGNRCLLCSFVTVDLNDFLHSRFGAKDKCKNAASSDQQVLPQYPVVSTETFFPVNDDFNGNLEKV